MVLGFMDSFNFKFCSKASSFKLRSFGIIFQVALAR
jgi:hypothetical protein